MARAKARGRPRTVWTDDMTTALFQFRYDALAAQFAQVPRDSWRELAARISDAFGVEVDDVQCSNKIRLVQKKSAQFLAQHPSAGDDVPAFVALVRQYGGVKVVDDHDEEEASGAEDDATSDKSPAVAPVAAESDATALSPFVSPPSSAKKRGRPPRSGEAGIQWTHELTEQLIRIRFESAPRESESVSSKSQHRVSWTVIASRLSDETGVRVEVAQCKNRMKVLMARWTQYIANTLHGQQDGDVAAEPPWACAMRQYGGDVVMAKATAVATHTQVPANQAMPVPSLGSEPDAERDSEAGGAFALDGDDDRSPTSANKRQRAATSSRSLCWTDAMVDKLFRLRYETLRDEFERGGAVSPHQQRHEAAWDLLAQHLSIEFSDGVDILAEQCKRKIKAVKIQWEHYKEAMRSGAFNMPVAEPDWVKTVRRFCGDDIVLDGDDDNDASEAVERLVTAPWLTPQRTPVTSVATVHVEPPSTTTDNRRASPPLMTMSPLSTVSATRATGSLESPAPARRNELSDTSSSSLLVPSAHTGESVNDTPVLTQILQTLHEQREAAVQQTRAVQELLEFLRNERSGRS